MPLSQGSNLGPYKVIRQIGAGGMGEVYKAKDTRLDRIVAIKVLPSSIADDTELRSRFEREARATSSLSHPNICTLHDVGNENGIEYLVMEYLEGRTLADRIAKGPLPLDEVLNIGTQIADALDTAHRQGLIHRDLKPSNVMLTKEGTKLLDFGLAKVIEKPHEGSEQGEPTQTALTRRETIIGTLQYMAPEQLQGKKADARSDIFAFGAVLYEMLAGQRAFDGDSKATLISSIMKEQPPPIGELREDSPPALDRVIKKCLYKDPDERWQSAKDLKDELDWIASTGSGAGISAPAAYVPRFRLGIAWAIAAIAVIAALVVAIQRIDQPEPERSQVRFSISMPESLTHIEWPQISPNGRYLAFVGYDTAGTSQIWIRPLNSNQAFPLAGTSNSIRPFWSPNSEYLAFFDQDKHQLMKVPVGGGQPQLVSKAFGVDGSWGRNDLILFDDYKGGSSIGWVSAKGGKPKLAVAPDTNAGENNVGWPEFLPDGRHFIYTAGKFEIPGMSQAHKLKVGVIGGDLNKTLGEVGSQTIYCPPGFLIYVKDGYLVAHPFDTQTLEFGGEPIPLTDSISFVSSSSYRGINASASDDGTLVWQGRKKGRQKLVWVDRQGHELDTVGPRSNYVSLHISPDNSHIASTIREGWTDKLRIEYFNIKQQEVSRIPTRGKGDFMAAWSPDSKSFAYISIDSIGVKSLKYKTLGGPINKVKSLSKDRMIIPVKWVDSTRVWYIDYPSLIGTVSNTETFHLMSIDVLDTSQVDTLLNLTGQHVPFGVSPDNRYFLGGDYWGVDWGMFVYDLSQPGQRWRLPVTGGEFRWSPQGDEIFYFSKDDFTALEVDLSDELSFGSTSKLFVREPVGMSGLSGVIWGYDISHDARRFLFATSIRAAEDKSNKVEVLLNWHTELGQP